ncbi:MAG: transcriptional regulator [Deltaproteobacteria bacterium]|nr:transcriptional regulator [Deltaproteobacteria bacterium]MBW2446324.1 transcriptional regulator [Deltaproteobacteria bacterium]
MGEFRYPQFCPFARATEILGQRWTILILRNVAFGPQRFSDLKMGLQGISTSVLASRLEELVERGLLRQRTLDPPAASVVYELGPAGVALTPAMMELARWGARFLDPPEPGDQIEASWARSAIALFKRWEPTPEVRLEIRITGEPEDLVVAVAGGPDGTTVENRGEPDADASLRLDPATLISALLGHFAVGNAIADGRIQLTGQAEAADLLPELFDLDRGRLGLPSTSSQAPSSQTSNSQAPEPQNV